MLDEANVRFLAYVNSLTAEMWSVIARLEMYKAANTVRQENGFSTAYSEESFLELANQLEDIQQKLATT